MFAKTDSRRTKLVTIGLLTMVLASAAHGQIYRTVDENGNVVFTDIPPREGDTAEQVIVEQPNSFAVEEAIGPREQWIVEPEATAEDEPAFSYKSLEIKSPQDDEAVRENAGNITVIGVASPRLQQGHRMRLVMDGQPVEEGRQSQFALENVDRGTHVLALEIIDDKGRTLIRSDQHSFHMLRVSVRPAPAG